MNKLPTTLAIDTSCDETSASVVEGVKILSNIQPSQMEYHKKFGGVVPSLAKLAHIDRLENVVNEAMSRAKKTIDQIDTISVTVGPGLAMALEVGLKHAIKIATDNSKPLILVNHMEGHLLSSFGRRNSDTSDFENDIEEYFDSENYPVLGVLISGGHTEFILVKGPNDYEKIGEILDDSCGECLDKCGRMLGLGYPAGPVISDFSKAHRKNVKISEYRNNRTMMVGLENKKGHKYELPIPMTNSGDLNMSFSGLKTAFKQLVNEINGSEITKEDELNENAPGLTRENINDLCVLIEAATFRQITFKLEKAIEKYNPEAIWLGGGVVASPRLRSVIRQISRPIPVKYPFTKKLTTDNAAMIGVTANLNVLKLQREGKFSKENKATLLDYGIYFDSIDFTLIDRDPSLSL